jgi:hypothetical protein
MTANNCLELSPEEYQELSALEESLTPWQRAELEALYARRFTGDEREIAGLRVLGLQDEGLYVTPLGSRMARFISVDKYHRDRFYRR